MRKLLLALALASLAFLRPAAAQEPSLLRGGVNTPNFLGSTGLLYAPSAYTVGDQGISAFVTGSDRLSTYGGLFGVSDRLELGVSFLDFHNGGASDNFAINGKFALLKETTVIPGLAVGVVDAFNELSLDQSWYVVASKDLTTLTTLTGFNLSAHAGYGHGIYGKSLFAGAEVRLGRTPNLPVIGSPTFSGIAEWVDGDVNLGLRGRYKGFAATIGLFDFGQIGGGISYTTGLRLW